MREDPNRLTGWLEPDGTFHQCNRTEHADLAYKLIGGETVAFQSGWLALLNCDVACGFGMPAYKQNCTAEQIQWLKEHDYGELLEDD